MHRTVLPLRMDSSRPLNPRESVQVAVHIHAEVMAPERAQHTANVWLAMNAGHLLSAENPELLLDEPLQWRFDVFLTAPDLVKPGTATRALLSRMFVDASTGAIVEPDALIQELIAHAAARSVRTA
jgi:hypothetical protein